MQSKMGASFRLPLGNYTETCHPLLLITPNPDCTWERQKTAGKGRELLRNRGWILSCAFGERSRVFLERLTRIFVRKSELQGV